jgi:hypothetical protein
MNPVCSAAGMNSPGARNPRLGWFQAHEGLDAGERPNGELPDRLVVEHELAAFQPALASG